MQEKRHDRVVEMRLCFFLGKVEDYNVSFVETRMCRSTIQWQNEIQKKGYSDSYLRMIQNQLTSLFTHAAKIYDLPVNPCKKVKRMGNSDSRSLNFWTLDEYKQFIQTTSGCL